jgi:hypothetical protein
VVAAVLALSLEGGAAQRSLAELARIGATEITLGGASVPFDALELLAHSGLVVVGTVRGLKSYYVKDLRIDTDCAVEINDVIIERDGKSRQIGDVITVRRKGGALAVGNVTMTATESGFPAFQVGEQYVLFLEHNAALKALMVFGGGQGAFRVDGDSVARQVTHFPGDTPEERPVVDRPVYDLRNLILDLATAR